MHRFILVSVAIQVLTKSGSHLNTFYMVFWCGRGATSDVREARARGGGVEQAKLVKIGNYANATVLWIRCAVICTSQNSR